MMVMVVLVIGSLVMMVVSVPTAMVVIAPTAMMVTVPSWCPLLLLVGTQQVEHPSLPGQCRA
jgi:hypothetical protein